MKKMIFLALVSFGLFSCSNEEVATDMNGQQKPGKGNSSSAYEDYNVAVTQNADGTVWTYTITKAKANAKNLSHFIVNLGNCVEDQTKSATFGDINWATINGEPADMSATEGSGTGCNPQAETTNFIKFNTNSGSSWVIVIEFDRGFYATQATSWIKAGTSCNTGLVDAPGCPKEEYCSFSQGYFFGGGVNNNGAAAYWANGLTIGSVTYTQAQGLAEWDANTGQGSDAGMKGFFQLGAVRLSGLDIDAAGLSAQAALIDLYFNGLDVTTVSALPAERNGVTKAQVSAAASQISTFIQANHC